MWIADRTDRDEDGERHGLSGSEDRALCDAGRRTEEESAGLKRAERSGASEDEHPSLFMDI